MNSMLKKTILVLGIETSCDDTSIAIIRGEVGATDRRPTILAAQSFSQETLLRKWGGVVPEIAARNHTLKLTPLLEQCFQDSALKPAQIDLIGVTTHPGLLGPLLTGLNHAKTLALFFEKPILPVNHLYAHLEAIHLTNPISYPYLGLLVSGGHSLFTLVTSAQEFSILGSTLDDAAGEAFDKAGKLMGLGYPAGRIIDQLAKEGDPHKYKFPIGLQRSADTMMSFSGVKTSMRSFLEKNPSFIHTRAEKAQDESFSQEIKDLSASYQHAIVSALTLKTKYALKKAAAMGHANIPIVLGGGVACNSYLRKELQRLFPSVYCVEPQFCTDNGAMIANYALRTASLKVDFPGCLKMDARGRFVDKAYGRKSDRQ